MRMLKKKQRKNNTISDIKITNTIYFGTSVTVKKYVFLKNQSYGLKAYKINILKHT